MPAIHISKSIEIAATPDVVFQSLLDFKQWRSWSPWLIAEPTCPVTYGTTEEFLAHFGLDGLGDLPGLSDLKAAGLLDADLPPDFQMPSPREVAAMLPDELPLEDEGDAEDEETDAFQPEEQSDEEDDAGEK